MVAGAGQPVSLLGWVNSGMRWHEIINERMAEFAALVDEVRALGTAKADPDPFSHSVILHFVLHGEPGLLRVSLRPQGHRDETNRVFRARIYAAAMAVGRGTRPRTFDEALSMIRGRVGPRAIKILTAPETWRVEKLRWAGSGTA